MIHRYALASNTLPAPLHKALDLLMKILNYIKSGTLNALLFKELCKDLNADHGILLCYTAVRWLLIGNVNCVFELKDEINFFIYFWNCKGNITLLPFLIMKLG